MRDWAVLIVQAVLWVILFTVIATLMKTSRVYNSYLFLDKYNTICNDQLVRYI